MTAHIDTENIETNTQECNTHDLHALQKALLRSEYAKRGYMFLLAISVFFNLIFIISRAYNG
ncbi:hypothetical protein [Pseudoalteromonas phage C7]|uniref:hypothetical protein n=1 Tax=Pseudoalteromonas phage C7 TaxID=2510494 RepID=UPI001017C1E0|nr:hypothetical protein PP587_gp69 [Pseudoalteromonas phage C7]QAY18023.1 hypothetical protein [Pseudoalteromonas phage C7]